MLGLSWRVVAVSPIEETTNITAPLIIDARQWSSATLYSSLIMEQVKRERDCIKSSECLERFPRPFYALMIAKSKSSSQRNSRCKRCCVTASQVVTLLRGIKRVCIYIHVYIYARYSKVYIVSWNILASGWQQLFATLFDVMSTASTFIFLFIDVSLFLLCSAFTIYQTTNSCWNTQSYETWRSLVVQSFLKEQNSKKKHETKNKELFKETVKHVIDVRWHEITEAEEVVFSCNAGS